MRKNSKSKASSKPFSAAVLIVTGHPDVRHGSDMADRLGLPSEEEPKVMWGGPGAMWAGRKWSRVLFFGIAWSDRVEEWYRQQIMPRMDVGADDKVEWFDLDGQPIPSPRVAA